MKTYKLTWSPEGKMIANNVQAESPSKARSKAPQPYKKYKGEIAVDELFWFYGETGIELSMTAEQARSASHQGQCDDDVQFLSRSANVKEQLEKIDADKLKRELKSYGAWDESELADHDANLLRFVWIAASNIKDEIRQAAIEAAKQAIEKRKDVCFDVAANAGQIFDNVKHMTWFIDAVANELES